MNAVVTAVLFSIMLGLSLPAFAAELLITLTDSPPRMNAVTTKSLADLTLRTTAGHTVHFARSAGHDYRQQARGGALWAEVRSVPLNAESISLTPTLTDAGSLVVAVELSRKQNDETLRYNSNLTTAPGVWVKLFGPEEPGPGAGRVYSTNKQADEALYLRIEVQ